MQTRFVFKLSALALMGLSLGAFAPFQDADGGSDDAPRPRLQLPRGFTSAAPSLGMLRTGETPKLGVMIEIGGDGIVVKEVQDDSLAAALGVQPGDLLLSLDGRRVVESGDIGRALAEVAPGDGFTLSVVREGEGLVKLEGTRPEPPAPKVAKSAPADGHRGALLGVTLGEAADDGGVTVTSVHEGTAAWFATLEDGDVLTKVGDTAVNSAAEVAAAVAAHEPGTAVTLSWIRAGKSHSNQVRLGHRASGVSVFGQGGDFPGFVIPRGNARGGSFLLGNDPQLKGNVLRFHDGADGADVKVFPFGSHDGDLRFDVQRFQNTLKGTTPRAFHLRGFDGLHVGKDHKLFSLGGPDGKVLDLHEILEGAGVDLDELKDGAQQLQIKIQDGQLEIVTDGEVQVHDLDLDDDAADDDGVERTSSVIYSYSTSGAAPKTSTRLKRASANGPFVVVTGSDSSCSVVCDPTPACEVECETECDSDAEADAACDVELVDELPVQPAAASDDDLL